MDKQNTQPDVVSQLRDWLCHTGYSLEFRTAEALRKRKWRPSLAAEIQGRKATDVPRDVDVIGQRCFHAADKDKPLKTVGYLLIECKHVPQNTAWLLLGEHLVHETRAAPPYVPRATQPASVAGGVGIPIPTTRTPPGPNDRVVSSGIRAANLNRNDKEHAKNSSERPDSAFAAVSKVKELSWALAAECRKWDSTARIATQVFVVPCVVIKGTLARVDFSAEDATPIVREVECGAVLLSTPPEATLVHVVREQHFGRFVDEYTKLNQSWNDELARALRKQPRSRSGLRYSQRAQSKPTT